MRSSIGQGLMLRVERSLIAVVVGELRFAAIIQFPTFRQRVSLVDSKQPFAYFLVAVNIEVPAYLIQIAIEILCARLLIVGIGNAKLQTERCRIGGIYVV